MSSDRFDRLTEGQKECLRLFHARWEVKDIARSIGRSPVTVNQRLTAARRHLGVDRSAEAARLLAEHENASTAPTYSPPIYEPLIVGEGTTPPAHPPHGDGEHWGFPMPFPTRGRPANDLTFTGKIIYALVLAALIALVFGGAVSSLSGLSDIF